MKILLCITISSFFLLNLSLARSNIFYIKVRRRNFIVRCCGEDTACKIQKTTTIFIDEPTSSPFTKFVGTSSPIRSTSGYASSLLLTKTTDARISTLNKDIEKISSSAVINTSSISTTSNKFIEETTISNNIIGTTINAQIVSTAMNIQTTTTDTSTNIGTATTMTTPTLTTTSTRTTTTTLTTTTTMTTTSTKTTTTTMTTTITTTMLPFCENILCPKNCNCSVNLLDLTAEANFVDFDGNAKFSCGIPINIDPSLLNAPAIRKDYFCCSSCVEYTNKTSNSRRKRSLNNTILYQCIQELKNVIIIGTEDGIKINFDVVNETVDCKQLYGQNLTIIAHGNRTNCDPLLYMLKNGSRVPACSKISEMVNCNENHLNNGKAKGLAPSDKYCISYQSGPCQTHQYKCFQNASLRWMENNLDASCDLHDIGDGRLYHFVFNRTQGMTQENATTYCNTKCAMNLGTIDSAQQNYQLSAYMYNLIDVKNLWWIRAPSGEKYLDSRTGLVSEDFCVTWKWPNNIPATYLNWAPYSPDISTCPIHCGSVGMLKSKDLTYHAKFWGGCFCDATLAVICSN